jgi:hypothetical protein
VILSINSVVDIWAFLKHLWVKDLFKTQHKTHLEQISKSNVDRLAAFFRNKQDKILAYKEVAEEIRNDLNVFQSILRIL